MSKLRLTFACGPYDRTLALRDGSVQPEGIELNYIASQPPDIFWRMLQFDEFEISEMSLSNYTTLVSTGKAPFVAIPASVAGLPPRLLLHQHRQGNQDAGRSQGQARGRPRIHHDGGGLYARPAAARIWRQAERRRMGAGPRRSPRPQAARGHSPHSGAPRDRARRPARARRDRLHDEREQS